MINLKFILADTNGDIQKAQRRIDSVLSQLVTGLKQVRDENLPVSDLKDIATETLKTFYSGEDK